MSFPPYINGYATRNSNFVPKGNGNVSLAIARTAATEPAAINSSSFATGTGAGTVITKPSNTVNGNFLIAYVTEIAGTGIVAPAGWTEVQTVIGTGNYGAMFFKVASSEPANYTFTDFGSAAVDMCVAMLAITTTAITKDTNDGGALGNVAGQSGTISITIPSITTTQNNCILVMGVAMTGVNVATGPAITSTSVYQYTLQQKNTVFQRLGVELFSVAGVTGTRLANYVKTTGAGTFGNTIIVAIPVI